VSVAISHGFPRPVAGSLGGVGLLNHFRPHFFGSADHRVMLLDLPPQQCGDLIQHNSQVISHFVLCRGPEYAAIIAIASSFLS